MNLSTPIALRLLVIAALSAFIAFAYQDIDQNTFLFDDWPNILDNASVRMHEFSLAALIDAAQGSFLQHRPLPSVTFALDWWRGGGQPGAFLITNLTLHIVTGWAVFILLLSAAELHTDQQPRHFGILACGLAALWWAAQPIHVQAVSYIVQRMTELAALFSLLCVWAWVKARTPGSRPWLWILVSIVSFGIAASSKPNAWITPLLVLMAEFLLVRGTAPFVRSWKDRALLSVPILIGAAAAADMLWEGPISRWALAGYAHRDFTLVERLLTQPKVVLFHVSQILWPLPVRFSLEHDVTIVRSMANLHFWAPMAIIVFWCAAGIALAARPRYRVMAFFVLWVPVTLLIESSVVPLELIFEHRMYLPAVGFAGLLALGMQHAMRAGTGRAVAIGTCTLVAAHALFALYATYTRIPQWRSERALYEQATIVAPNSARAWNHLGVALLAKRQGERVPAAQHRRALDAFDRAIALAPDFPAPWTNRGVARYTHGDIDGALDDLRTAISLSSREAAAQHYLGEIYRELGRHQEARIAKRRACALGVTSDCAP